MVSVYEMKMEGPNLKVATPEENGLLEDGLKESSKREAPPVTVKRQTWDSRAQSFCAILGAIIGMGNLWRFPYMCYENGGGAFLLPYIFCVVFIGFPLFFLEMALGQFTKQGAIGAWNIVPLMRGVGLGSAILVTYSSIYFIVIIAWGFFYLFHSFTRGDLPFNTCDNYWNTPSCRPYSFIFNNISENGTSVDYNYLSNSSTSEVVTSENRTLPIKEFWSNYVLRESNGFEGYGNFENWQMMLCLILAWVVTYLCIINGIKSAGKVALLTATLPYVLIAVLLVKGCMLPGAYDGIYYYLKPNISKLAEPQVWIQAGGQVCYSYAIGFAALITMGSFNKFHKDCYRTSMLLVGSCAMTSFVTGFAVFSVIGNLAFVTGKNVSDVVQSGPGLVFEAFPTALSLLPLPQLWNALFFFMLIMIGLDSQFACVECLIVIIIDHWPAYFETKRMKIILRTVVCSTMLVIGVIFIPSGGLYVFELFNNYAVSGIAILWIAMMEGVAIAYFYGIEKFYGNIREMIGYRPSPYFKISLLFITPVLTLGIMLFNISKYTPLSVAGYQYPVWADMIGWLMCLSSLLCVPAVFIYTLYKEKGTLKERFMKSLRSPIGHLSEVTTSGTEERLIISSTVLNGVDR